MNCFVLDIDECKKFDNYCKNGRCVNTAGGSKCFCPDGFFLNRMENCEGTFAVNHMPFRLFCWILVTRANTSNFGSIFDDSRLIFHLWALLNVYLFVWLFVCLFVCLFRLTVD